MTGRAIEQPESELAFQLTDEDAQTRGGDEEALRRTRETHGSPGAALVRANCEQLRGSLVEKGYIGKDEIDGDLRRLDAADFAMPSSIMWTAYGRRPHCL